MRTPENLSEFEKLADSMIESGVLTMAQADDIRCHPDAGAAEGFSQSLDRVASKSVDRDAPKQGVASLAVSAMAVSCGGGYTYTSSARHIQEIGTPVSLKAYSSLSWCYKKSAKKVKNWAGICDGDVTKWGKVNGWSFEGCTRNDFIPYTLNKSYPGGIHHATKAHFVNNFTFRAITIDLKMDIWGHYDGTCDHRGGNSTIYHYC